MDQPVDFRALARRSFDREIKGPTSRDVTQSLASVTGRLVVGLSPIFGATGVRLILRRALIQSSSREPILTRFDVRDEGVQATSEPGLPDVDPIELRRAAEDVFVSFCEVLSRLVGPALASRFVGNVLANQGYDAIGIVRDSV